MVELSQASLYDWVADVLKFICYELIDPLRKSVSQQHQTSFNTPHEVLQALSFDHNEVTVQEWDDEEDQTRKENSTRQQIAAIQIIKAAGLDVETVRRMNSIGLVRNPARHSIDSTRYKDRAYMAEQLMAFQSRVTTWSSEHASNEELGEKLLALIPAAYSHKFGEPIEDRTPTPLSPVT